MKLDKSIFLKAKKMPRATWIGLVLVVVLLTFNGVTFARYIMTHQDEPLYVAQNFYFESDMLQTATTEADIPSYTLQAGSNNIGFHLKNYTDQLRYSEVDIQFTMNVTNVETGNAVTPIIEVKNGGETIVADASGSYMIGTGACEDIDVAISGLNAGTYLVSATSSPYACVLKAKFTVVGSDDQLTWTVSDATNSLALQLTIETGDRGGNAIISWPNTVLPDNTDPYMESATGASHEVSLESNSTYAFTFFKTDPTDTYLKDEFQVSWKQS